ncbi:MAG: hypothetical protein DRQ78_04105 [Epsilonproteobacteria bacterium]|nr:MAG: hypothetical protein DRQ78_04105 [Campylobacterota bacterium]
MSKIEERKKQSVDAIRELRKIKSTLSEELADVRVILDEKDNPSIAKAITQVFGEMSNDDPRKGYITFDMYMTCLRILRAAGGAKASSILEREFV